MTETHHSERSKQEVQQLHSAGVLDVLPQSPLQETQSVKEPPESSAHMYSPPTISLPAG